MGCGSCGVSDKSGKVSGCGSSGGCSSGGCNRLNVFDWLADLPHNDFGKQFPIFEASFNKGSRKEFFINHTEIQLDKGSFVTVEGINGFDVAEVSLTGELVKLQLKKYGVKEEDVVKKFLHYTTESEFELFQKNKKKEKEILIKARAISRSLNLDMKIGETEIQADGKKISIFYTAVNRVDFRELIKVYAQEFNARIEMRQIGTRQESGKVGGIGSCGRELCCSTWLTDFKTVYTSAARYQNLSINQTKLSGQCGKLKCCLNYELDTYMDALVEFPNNADTLLMKSGKVKLIKKDIFKGLMWYCYETNSKYYPLSIQRVKEIQELNAKNIFPDELEPVEIIKENKKSDVSIDAGFVNDVGQITLTSLTKKKKNQKNKNNSERKSSNSQNPSGNTPIKSQNNKTKSNIQKNSPKPKSIESEPKNKVENNKNSNKKRQASPARNADNHQKAASKPPQNGTKIHSGPNNKIKSDSKPNPPQKENKAKGENKSNFTTQKKQEVNNGERNFIKKSNQNPNKGMNNKNINNQRNNNSKDQSPEN